MKKIFKILIIVFVIILVAIQLIRPERSNPVTDKTKEISASLNVPSEVKSIFERACYDCHSNNTKWPWYSNIAPVSWLVAQDVNEGRENMNFSEWGTYELTDRIDFLNGIGKMVKKGAMPMPKYLMLHPEAKLTDSDKELVIKWAKSSSDSLMEE